MRKEKGITLIALVITIIVLIILAGISIQLLLGENGIITKAKKGKGDYQESAVKEKVEMELANYNSEKLIGEEEGKVEEALNKLLENNTFDDIEVKESLGIIDDYEITLTKENNLVIIKDIDKVVGKIRIKYSLNPSEYTYGNVEIIIKATGNVVKLIKPDNTEVTATNGEVETTYTVDKNGIYTFTAEDSDGNKKTREIVIDTIKEIDPTILGLKVRDYIKYDTGVSTVGENGVITCRVLYPVDSGYGLQVVSCVDVTSVSLGGNNLEDVLESYNNAIDTLNSEAEKYINSDYAYDARCLGSIPSVGDNGMFTDKDSEGDWVDEVPYLGSVRQVHCKNADQNYSSDWSVLGGYSNWLDGTGYWLASRAFYQFEYGTGLSLICVGSNNGNQYEWVCTFDKRVQGPRLATSNKGVRPCISLKYEDLKIVEGDGKSVSTAYIIQ